MTIGYVFSEIRQFYIVGDGVPLIKSGISGQPFLDTYYTIIHIGKKTVVLESDTIKIPTRIECVLKANVSDTCHAPGLTILLRENSRQSMFGGCVDKIKNQQLHANAVNSSESDKIIMWLELNELHYETYNGKSDIQSDDGQ